MADKLTLSVRRRRTLTKAWLAIQRNGRLSKSVETRAEVRIFAEDAPRNIDRIQARLQKGTFIFPAAKGIKAKKKGKPGFRPLVLAPVESRIVQRAVHDVLLSIPAIEAMIRTPYSFGGVKKHEDDELSAVPAAIKAVLNAIGNGGAYVIRSDISKFFTRIPKSEVRKIIEPSVAEADFLSLYDKAVSAELSNMRELREDIHAFPIEDIGVAQGNSLSPLLGNLLLKDFDIEMNAIPHVCCIRYIDDFILLGPNKHATVKAFNRAKSILSQWQMTLALEKTEQGSSQKCFEFLGIEFNNGFLRPSASARKRFVGSVESLIAESQQALLTYKTKGVIERRNAFLKTLLILSETMNGWGMHYRFCNDSQCMRQLDAQISVMLSGYFGIYRSVKSASSNPSSTWDILGIQSLDKIERESFFWPKASSRVAIP